MNDQEMFIAFMGFVIGVNVITVLEWLEKKYYQRKQKREDLGEL